MNSMLTMQHCMGEGSNEAANAGLQSVLSVQQEFHVEQQKNLPLALSGEVPHVLHNSHLQQQQQQQQQQQHHHHHHHHHHSSHLHCVPPSQQPLMGPDDSSRNPLVYYGNQPQVNMAHESPSHVSCDSPSHLAYNPVGHMNHNVPIHVAHNSPNHISHGSPVQWQHGSPVPMPCNSPGNVACHNSLHLAHSSPVHGSCNSPVHMSCNSGLHMPHNSPVHMSQGSPSPQSTSHGQANTAADVGQNGGFLPTLAERCKFCGVELPMDTLAVVAHFNSHWRQPEADTSSCSYIPTAMNTRVPHNPQFNVMHKYNVNTRFMNSISSGDDPSTDESHHAYAASFPFSTPVDTTNIAATDHNLKLYDHSLQREGNNHMVLQTAMHSQEGNSDITSGMSSAPKVLGTGENPHSRCSPLNLTGRSKLSASPLQQPPNLEGGGCPPSIENPIYMHSTGNDIAASVLHTSTGDPQLINTNTMSNGVSYQTMYSTSTPFFGASCPYNSSVTLPPQSVACKIQPTFVHNLDNVGLSIPVLSPNLASVEEEHNSGARREEPNKDGVEERGSALIETSECIPALHSAGQSVSLDNNTGCTIGEASARLGDRDTCISGFKSFDREPEKPSSENVGHISNQGIEKESESREVCTYPTDAHPSIGTTGTEVVVSSISCLASTASVTVANCNNESSRPDLSKPSTNTVGLCTTYRSSCTVGNSQFPLNTFLPNPSSMTSPSSQHSYPFHSMTLSQPSFPSDQSLVSTTPHTYSTNFISISSHFNSAANSNLMAVPSVNQPSANSGIATSVPENTLTLQPSMAVGQACGGDHVVFPQQHSTSVIVPHPPPLLATSPVVTAASSAPKPYKCSVCNQEFNLKEDLKAHFLAHEAAKPFHCDVCGLGVCNQKALKRHKLTHSGLKPYKCDTCGRSFLQKHDLNRHMTIHDRPKYLICEQCKRTFTGLSPFKNHKCKGVKVGMPYLCHICGDGCSNRLSWSYHMWKHTKNPMFVPFQENVSPLES
ncbi:Zinc finger C2H2-type [Trinorchestia longiramus]|nr:Zinc finger C2H2-type [Trinorchestia longiramus]